MFLLSDHTILAGLTQASVLDLARERLLKSAVHSGIEPLEVTVLGSNIQFLTWKRSRILLFLSVSLPVEPQDRFAHLTGVLDHHHIGDIMTVLSMVEQALKTGNAPPEVLPTPLLNRCHEYWQNRSLETIQYRDLVRDKDYRKFCVTVSSYLKFLSAIDDLVLVMKGSLGECHIISKRVTREPFDSDLSMENGRSGGLGV